MKEEIYVTETVSRSSPALMRRVSWGAIIAGLFVTVISQVTLTLLGAAIGAATIDPTRQQHPMEAIGTAAGIWFIVSGLVSLFAGAYVAGRLSGGPRRADGLLHGIVLWSVAEVTMLVLLTTAVGGLIGGTANVLARVVQYEQAEGRQPLAQLQQQIDRGVANAEQKLAPTGRETGTPGAPVVNEQQAREVGQQAASGISMGSLFAFIAMVLGLGVGAWGGWVGTASLPRYQEPVAVQTTA